MRLVCFKCLTSPIRNVVRILSRDLLQGNGSGEGSSACSLNHFRIPRSGQKYLNRPFRTVFGLQWATTKFMKPSFYPLRNCWRVRVPASESETGKRFAKYFETKEAAEHFVAEHRKTGSIQLAELSVQEKHVLGLIRQSQHYAPELLLDVWRAYLTRKQTPH